MYLIFYIYINKKTYCEIKGCRSFFRISISCFIFAFACFDLSFFLLKDLIATSLPLQTCKAILTLPNAPLPITLPYL